MGSDFHLSTFPPAHIRTTSGQHVDGGAAGGAPTCFDRTSASSYHFPSLAIAFPYLLGGGWVDLFAGLTAVPPALTGKCKV